MFSMIVSLISQVKIGVYAATEIQYHGRVSYGGSTVGSFTVDGQTAFCAEHDKTSPSTGATFHDEIYGNADILKVLYYGWGGAAQWSGFESEAHGIVATSLTISHYYSGTNIKNANRSFYEWLQTQPNAPDNNVSISKSDLESYIEGDSQRTEDITLGGDNRNVVVFPLPDGVALHNVSSGAVQTGNVGVRCGETFYLTAPMSMNSTWNSGELKGMLPLYQPVLSVTSNVATQNLVRYRTTDPTNSITLNVKWSAVGYLEIQKTDSATGQALAGAVYGIYKDSGAIGKGGSSSLQLLEQLTLDANGHALSGQLVAGRYYVKEITAPVGYELDTNTYTYDVPAGQTILVGATDKFVTGSITVTKKDGTTGNTLPGTELGLYAANTITHPDGKTGTIYNQNQLVATFPATGNDGKSVLNNLYLGDYYVKEINARPGYKVNDTKYPVSLKYAGQNVSVIMGSAEVTNERVTGSVTIKKVDKETGKTAQGDATFKGATYGLYAANTITHPDGKTGTLYSKDQLVATFPETDDMGEATIENLYLGDYYAKEIKASPGYLVDDTKYPISLKYEGQNMSVVTKKQTVKEQVIKGRIQLVKHLQEPLKPSTNKKPQKPEVGAEFQIILKSTGKIIQTITTDSDGFAMSDYLPYGTYIVHQSKGKEGYELMDDFEVKINAEGRTYSYILENVHYTANLKVVKTDAETGKTVAIAGATFQIIDSEGKLVEQDMYYPERKKISEFKTDKDGTLMLPEQLVYGDYTLIETEAPDGYLITDPIPFTVSKAGLTTDEWGDDVIVVNCSDIPVKGKIKIEKTGKVLTGFKDGKFVYEEKGIPNCVFRVTAAETIYSPDHAKDVYGERIVLYEKGEEIAELTTDEEGKAETDRLFLGDYEVEEISAPEGFLKEPEKQKVSLRYKDQKTELVFATDTVYNENQQYQIEVEKTDSKTEKTLAGAEFSLYAAQDILSISGDIVVEKDALIGKVTTDEEGKAQTGDDFPTNVYVSEKDSPMYYLIESKVPNGYVSNNERYNLLGKAEEGKKVTLQSEKITNTPTQVSFLKTDEKDNPLAGAVLRVREKDADTIFGIMSKVTNVWVTDGKEHVISNLETDKVYILEELEAPNGYATADPVEFTVEDIGEVQKIVMKDDVTKVQISKTDITGEKELPGAKLQILDSTGKVIEEWESTEEPHYMEKLPKGEYVLHEETEPNGYVTAEDIPFTVKDTGEVQKVVMKDAETEGKISIHKTEEGAEKNLAGAVFEIRNGDGEVLDTITTDENGKAESKNIPVSKLGKSGVKGKWTAYVVEVKAPEEYVLDETQHEVTFEWKDGTVPVIEAFIEVTNKRVEKEVPQPKTGDKTPIKAFMVTAAIAGTVMAVIFCRKKNRKNNKRNSER